MRRLRWLRGQDVSVLFAIIAVIVIPAMFTLNTVKVPITGSDVKLNPTPLGYTVSLLIYLVPVLALYWWFSRRCPEGDGAIRRNSRVVLGRLLAPPREYRLDYRRSAYRWTLLTLIPLGFLLDIVFGYAFLTFNNREATLTSIPLFPAFDLSKGQLVSAHSGRGVRVLHAWASWRSCPSTSGATRTWLDRYNVPDYEVPPSGTRGLPPFIAQVQIRTPLIVSIALVSAAFVYKRLLAPPFAHEGFPWYFTFLVVASLFPAILLFRSTQRFINWRAVSFTVFWVVAHEPDLGSHAGVAVRVVGLSAVPHDGLVCRCVVQAANRGCPVVGVGDLHDRRGLRDVQDSHQHETRVWCGLVDGDVRATKCRSVGERAAPPGAGRLRG